MGNPDSNELFAHHRPFFWGECISLYDSGGPQHHREILEIIRIPNPTAKNVNGFFTGAAVEQSDDDVDHGVINDPNHLPRVQGFLCFKCS